MKKEDKKKDSVVNKIITWFKGLSSGKKIAVIVGVVVFCLFCVVVSGDTDKNTQQPAQPTETTQKSEDQKKHDEELKVAYKKCMLMEMTDIYNMPDASFIGQKYTKQQASTPANTFCVEQKNADEEKYLEAVNVDWEDRKNEVILGYPLTYWLENYHLFPQKYYDSFEQ